MLGFFAAVPGKITAQDSPSGHMQPMSTACADTFTSLLNSPLLPADAAAPAGYVHAQAWQTESAHNSAAASVGQIVQHQWQGYTHGSGSAVTDNALAAVSNAQESDQQQLQQQQLWTHVQPNMPGMPAQQEPMQLGHSSNAGPGERAQ